MSDEERLSYQKAKGSYIAQADQGGMAIVGNENIVYTLSPIREKEERELRMLLNSVRQYWIDGYLKNSLYNEVLIQLGKETRLDAVEHPWERVVEVKNTPQKVLSSEANIKDIFDEMGRAMLILGDPGSGKTITLLELARDLLILANDDPYFSYPVPVVFNLSSWSEKQSTLLDWLVNELLKKYRVQKKNGHTWLENNRILPLLDGLDEVKENFRNSCVKAINDFSESYGLSGLVVTCREEEFGRISVPLKFNGAIFLKPLSAYQVDQYLVRGGSALTKVREALQSDKLLKSLSQSPLMLNIITLTYCTSSSIKLSFTEDDTSDTPKGYKELFDAYIEQMFLRKGTTKSRFKKNQTIKGLSWLAKNLVQNDQTIFLVEQLQPSFLRTSSQKWFYALGSRIIGATSLSLVFPALLSVIYSFPAYEFFVRLLVFIVLILFFGFIGVTFGVIEGIIDAVRMYRNRVYKSMAVLHVSGFFITSALWHILIGILIFLPIFSVMYSEILSSGTFVTGLFTGSVVGMGFGVIYTLKSIRPNINNDIQTIETLRLQLSWRLSRSGAFKGLFIGFSLAVIWGLCSGLSSLYLSTYFPMGSTFGFDEPFPWAIWNIYIGMMGSILLGICICALPLGSIGAILGMLTITKENVDSKTYPNQGIHLSLRNTIYIGLISGLISGLILWLITSPAIQVPLIDVLVVGLIIGLPIALLVGGLDIIRHYWLRFTLYITGYTSHNLVQFLDHATERIFLRKVGGGYIFIHRMLLEHFADMYEEQFTQKT